MSRVGKLPIAIPSGVTITIDPSEITIAGGKGTLKQFTGLSLIVIGKAQMVEN